MGLIKQIKTAITSPTVTIAVADSKLEPIDLPTFCSNLLRAKGYIDYEATICLDNPDLKTYTITLSRIPTTRRGSDYGDILNTINRLKSSGLGDAVVYRRNKKTSAATIKLKIFNDEILVKSLMPQFTTLGIPLDIPLHRVLSTSRIDEDPFIGMTGATCVTGPTGVTGATGYFDDCSTENKTPDQILKDTIEELNK